MTLYRAKANGNIVELSDEAAASLVPDIYEEIEQAPPIPVTREHPRRQREVPRT